MKTRTLAPLAVLVVQQMTHFCAAKESSLGDLSLEELLELRESILEAKQNLTYYIEESDGDDDDDDDDNDGNDLDDGQTKDRQQGSEKETQREFKLDELLDEPKSTKRETQAVDKGPELDAVSEDLESA